MAYQPFTSKGQEMQALGFTDADVQDFEAMHDMRGQAELVQRHPDAASPEVMARVAQEIAQNAAKYRARLEHEGAGSVYESAYAQARLQPQPAPTAGDDGGARVRPGVDPFRRGASSVRDEPDALTQAQQEWDNTKQLSSRTLQRLGYGGAFSHFDMPERPGR